MTFLNHLKTALVGDPAARFVYLNNFEVERVWGRDEPGLPGAGLAFSSTTVNRMEELGVPLAGPGDAVLLKEPVDKDYLAYLTALGCADGEVLVVDHNEPERSVTGDALASPRLLDTLRGMADGNTYLVPLGVSADEERLSVVTGLPLAVPAADVFKAVNGKIYSRRLVADAGLTAVPGTECESLGELTSALRAMVRDGGDRVVVKESLGVSGRGMVVLDSVRRAEQLLRLLARRGAGSPVSFVVERWIDKRHDLNYQVVIGRDGGIGFEALKVALVENGVHKGHMFPARIGAEAEARLHEAAEAIGKRLHADGYHGVAGIDAMTGVDGTVYPCLEINARFNMATYQNRIAERLIGPDRHAIAATIGLRPARRHRFTAVRTALGDAGYDPRTRAGVLVNGFATLNAAVTGDRAVHGRVYVVCVAGSPGEAAAMRATTEERLTGLVDQP